MNTNKIAIIALVAGISISGFSLPIYADTPFSNADAKLVNTCLKSGRKTLESCVSRVKSEKPYRYYKTKGRNRNTNKWKSRKSVFKPNSAKNSSIPKSFLRPIKGGLRIDACVQGAGWKTADLKRCDKQRLKKIGNDFCKSVGRKKSVRVIKEAHKGTHAILNYNKSTPSNANWKRKKGQVAIKKITCK